MVNLLKMSLGRRYLDRDTEQTASVSIVCTRDTEISSLATS